MTGAEQDSDAPTLLAERVKELTLLHATVRLLQRDRGSDQDVLTRLATLLPPAWQFPDDCAARIAWVDVDARSDRWSDASHAIQCAAFATADGRPGKVEVAYRHAHPAAAEGPFLHEERLLVDSIAEMVAAWLDYRLALRRLKKLAFRDPITGLANRIGLEHAVAAGIEAARAGGHRLALIPVGIEPFRDVSNTFGHRVADALLHHVAASLRGVVGDGDVVAHLGFGTFAVLLTRITDLADAERVATAIAAVLRRPAPIATVPVAPEGSIGVALFPDHGDDAAQLWQRGDIALRKAQSSHRSYQVYSPEIDEFNAQRIALLGELPAAIERNELVLHYQPKIDLRSGRTIGVEALVRWQHPALGMVYPDRFILLAERTQVINPLTHWVLRTALAQCASCGLDFDLAINLSARNLVDPVLCAEMPVLVAAAGFAPDRLTLELTESAIIADPEPAKAALHALSRAGFAFSMDDFGVGQSSLTYLRDLPFSRMKIDKGFLIGFAEARNQAIVRAAIEIGHSLGLQVTAEGIEDDATRQALQGLGCEIGQGYLFSKPLPFDGLKRWLSESPWGLAATSS